tara:strand:+ start:352 stop:1560 length:1209 start_codon:yes stop_codon:yes gene_type:complete
MKNLLLLSLFYLITTFAIAQQSQENAGGNTALASSKWFDKVNVRGYAQVRYNRLLETNPLLKCEQCDRSWGEGGGFFMRRIRVIFYGKVSERVYFYIQPDFASAASSNSLHFAQIRDAYFDIGLDSKNEFRFRIGQSKVPYGFENMQSSQNRLPLDRNDALNSPLRNERDLGIFFYWAPQEKRQLYSRLSREGMKTSGDYGIVGFGVYNGQTANRPELNEGKHIVARITYPFEVGSQIIETSIQGFTGNYVLNSVTSGVKVAEGMDYLDERIAATFVLYPRPFGIQAEYNIGSGPEYNKETNSIENQPAKGGYITLSYFKKFNDHLIIPFTRFQRYQGGKKHELDARSYDVTELEIGVEYQPSRNFELVTMYTISDRRFEDAVLRNNVQSGSLLRIQAQVNF